MGTLTDQQKILIESKYGNEKKSTGIAYLLLCFTAVGHNFYLGKVARGIFQILSILCFGIGSIWVLIDLFLPAGMVRKQNEAVRSKVTLEALA